MMHLSQVSDQVNGTLVGADVVLSNISINTREDCDQRLFVALKGENFDAHDFLEQAQHAGAGAVMVERDVDTPLPSVRVESTHQALKDLATWWRSQFAIPLIGVTGSVGKTTVKEMLSCIFAELGEGVVTKGNLNNEIGVPITIMNLKPQSRYAIVEMGMNHAGEIARLTRIARPTIALINNAAAAHLEGLGSVEAVAKAKGEIFEGLNADGVAVLNNDDHHIGLWQDLLQNKKTISFGLSKEADVSATYQENNQQLSIEVTALGESFSIRLNAVGQHSVYNALAAVSVSLSANVPVDIIQSGLKKFRAVNGRMTIHSADQVTLIDDTYNANPASMRAAVEVLATAANSVLIVGDMAELGKAADDEHRKLGVIAAQNGISRLYACGQYAELVADGFGSSAKAFATKEELISDLLEDLPVGTTLVKGSRSAKMEDVVAALLNALNPKPSPESLQGET